VDSSGRTDTSLRGKSLHPIMARRVMDRYNDGYYEDAVLAAFKVIEKRLRDITGKPDAPVKELLHDTLNVTAGTLQDPKAWQSEREGMFGFFRSAFLAFRDRRAHEFVDTDGEEAFDLIVLTNRMLLLIEQGQQHSQAQTATPDFNYDKLSSLLGAYLSGHDDMVYRPKPVFLDSDNDGEPELLIPGQSFASNRVVGEVFRVFKDTGETIQQSEVENVPYSFPASHILLADADNDGQQEVVCTTPVGVGYNNNLLVYKYRNGRYEVLKKDPQAATGDQGGFAFFRAHVGDINDDGQVEVVSEPKLSGVAPPPVRYVWKWNEEEGVFKFLYSEELTYDWFPRST
jgi:uncharacterized protein (TIGR02391 family)